MTRKAGQKSEETRAALLDAATNEFAHKGFQKASLRSICSEAGVTTGALYFFFKNKEDVFREVIAPVEHAFEELVELFSERGFSDGSAEGQQISQRAHECLMELYEHRDAVSVVLENRDAPAVAEFYERAVSKAEDRIGQELSDAGRTVGDDSFLTHWYAHLQVEMALHTIRHSSSVEEAERHVKEMMRFVRGGLSELAK